MQNVTPMLARKDDRHPDEPGSNTLFFFLYTWPFFLALLPASVLIGIVFSQLLRGRLFWSAILTALAVVCLFWLLFSFLSGW